MPIATPEVYAEMLDRAKHGAFAYPAINVTSVPDPERRAAGLRRRRQRRHHPGLDRRRRVRLRPDRQGHGHRVRGLRRVRRRGRQELPGQHRAAHRPLPQGQARRLRAAAARRLAPSGSRPARPPLFQSHMWDGSAVPLDENLQIAEELLAQCRRGQRSILEIEIGVVGGEEDGVDGRDQRQALHHPRGRAGHGRGARHRRERPLHDGPDLRQRARRLQAGQRQAAPRDPQGTPRRRSSRSSASTPAPSRSTWSSTAARARCREEIADAVDYGVIKMNVDTDTQYAFTRPVVDHMFEQLRRRAQDRRRGRQQEGLRPARLGQGRRGRHGRPRRRGLREPPLGRHAPGLSPPGRPVAGADDARRAPTRVRGVCASPGHRSGV